MERISNYTVNSFRLTVGLRMNGCAHLQLASQTVKYLFEKRSCITVNRGSQSELLSPWIAKMWFRYKSAAPSAPILDVVGIKWTYLVRRSTKVSTASFPRVVLGRPTVMISILRLFQGRSGMGRGCKSPCFTLEDLLRWQSSQERTKSLTESPMRGQ